ncbi:universal stress protein [Aeromicrobium sp.]|uniref:universal stress protein n=1 Tax=Aeromicrobium sp. TaxID=1871063 RepID=UPI002FC7CD65
MKSVKPVVVVGIVDKQQSVLRFAARQARLVGAHLQIVNAAGPAVETAAVYPELGILKSLRDVGQHVLDDARKFLNDELDISDAEFTLADGIPTEVLKRVADGARMLVLGADDVPWYDRLIRTKVSGHVAMHARCPVVIVPEVAYPKSMEGDVVVTIDGDTSADGPLRFAFEQADARNGVLHVLHAVPPGTLPSDVADLRANMSEVLAGWRDAFPDVAVMDVFAVGDPKDVVARATSGAELVVVGRPHGRTMPFAISRPLASDVLRKANCPVAVVPADYRGA